MASGGGEGRKVKHTKRRFPCLSPHGDESGSDFLFCLFVQVMGIAEYISCKLWETNFIDALIMMTFLFAAKLWVCRGHVLFATCSLQDIDAIIIRCSARSQNIRQTQRLFISNDRFLIESGWNEQKKKWRVQQMNEIQRPINIPSWLRVRGENAHNNTTTTKTTINICVMMITAKIALRKRSGQNHLLCELKCLW